MKNLLLIILFFTGNIIYSQSCSVNAGGNATICGTAYTLQGSVGANSTGTPTWTLVSKPPGAPDPVIAGGNTLTPNVTGMTFPGNYVFQVSQPCTTGNSTSQVTITAPGEVSTFTAGPDITNVNATVGTVTLNGVVPAGYTAQWSAYNIYRWERSGSKTNLNSVFSSATTASTTFSLTNKTNHEIDPAYVVTLRITSTNNPSCFYEDTAIVRFIPNPAISPQPTTSRCVATGGEHYVDLQVGTPIFSTGTAGSSGNATFGTTVTVNPLTQPSGGNISFSKLYDDRIFFNGITAIGTYTFTVTVTNAAGTSTTSTISYTYSGVSTGLVSFLLASEPEQMMIYSSGGSGGEVKCGLVGQMTPQIFRFTINPSDPATVTTTVTSTAIVPAGGSPTIVTSGAGTTTRTATVTPPAGGWRVGTYRFNISTSNGVCPASTQTYYIHISDSSRPAVNVDNMTVCYPGSGVVTATVPLPAVYKGAVSPSYLQDFDAQYDFTVVSKPVGSGTPSFEDRTLRLLTQTSTVIGNLTMPGEYVFKIKSNPYTGSVGAFLDAEYACSGTSREDTFSIFISTQVNANAGSNISVTCPIGATIPLNGNDPGVASTGAWTLLSKPLDAANPTLANPALYNSNVTGFTFTGTYKFRWTITTGSCTSSSDVDVIVTTTDCPSPGGVAGADFWVKSDDAGTIATAWKDQTANINDIPNVGGIALSPADRAHNFHPYTTGYTAAKYFHNNTSVMNPLGNVEYPNINTSIFSAVRPTSIAGGRIIGIDNDAAFAAEPGVSITAAGRPRQYEFFNTVTSSDFSATFNIGQSNIFSALANNTVANGGTSAIAGGEKRLGLNGTYESFSGFAAANKFQIYGTNLRLGYATWDVNGAFPGDIMEVVWYNRTLTANEQSRVNSYLAVKNGVTLAENYLATDSNIVWDRTSNTGYNNNIFGLAKDDFSTLHQKQSGSVNSGQQLVLSTTGFANSNAANSTGLVNNLQFLMTGDNGLKQSLVTPLSYTAGSNGSVNYRFESIWKVQNTNTVGTVTVAWPKSVKNLYLVQSSNAVFDGTDTFTPMTTEVTVNGVVYNTVNVTLANGQFFTFAGYVHAPGGVISTLWYRADKGLAPTGGAVTSWTDFSYSQVPVTPVLSGATSAPSAIDGIGLNLNFNPGVTFVPANALGNTGTLNATSGANYTIFTSTTPVTGSGNDRVLGMNYSNLTSGNSYDSPGLTAPNLVLRNNAAGILVNAAVAAGYKYTELSNTSIVRNTFTNTLFTRALNGAVAGANDTYTNTTTGPDGGIIFGRNANNGGDDGGVGMTMAETIIFDGPLSANQINRVDSYLAIKGGITLDANTVNYLSSTSATVWSGSTNTGYNNNIFGIANDFISALDQKQSKSINDGQQLIIGAGSSLANTNALNTNSLTDGQFLMTGDNGLKQSLITPLSYTAGSNGIVNYRFESIWKAQNSNSVGTVTVAWPKSVKNLYLVQSPDAVFDGTDTFTPMVTEVTVNGVVYNTVNVTLANGQFFTFAGFGNAPGGVANGLSYWYRADKNATNTGAATDVTGWTDMWNGTTVAQLGTNALPKYVLGTSAYFNFNPGINFTVNTQTLGNNTVRTLTSLNYDVFTLTKEGTTHSGGNPRIFSTGMDNTTTNDQNWDGFGIWPAPFTALERRPYGGGTQFPNVSPAFDANIPSIMYFRNTNIATSKGLNGAAMASPTNFSAVGSMFGGHIFGDTRFSSNGSDNAGFMGHIGETIVYGAGTLSNTERRKVDSYLAIKYGITLGQVATDHYLDTDGNMVWNGASNTAYNSNIFGVSRDDIEVFEQKVSKSVNTGTILTVATINDFVNPNQAVARTGFANDKTYFLLGDNNVVATPLLNITVAGSTLKRIQRAWLSQRKNTPDALYFEANLSAYGASFTAGNTVWMVIADDAAFTTNVKTVAGTFTGGRWVFNNNFNAEGVQRYITFAEGKTLCYKPAITVGTPLTSKVGITAFNRAGAAADNWPMTRTGGWLALEAKTKGFVVNKVAFSAGNPVGIAPANFVEGMMVYDNTNKCMKIYTLKEGDASSAWHCISTQTCPD